MLPDLRVRQRDYLLEITRAITQELNLDKLLLRILRLAAQILAGQAGLVLLRDDALGWYIAASHGINERIVLKLDPLVKQVSNEADPDLFELEEVNRLLQLLTREMSLGLLTGVGLPMVANQRVIGIIFIFRRHASLFSREDQMLLRGFADQAAIAVGNAQSYRQVKREQQRLSGILDSMADGMLILSPDHTIERCNPAVLNMLGYSLGELVGYNHDQIVQWARRTAGNSLEQAEAEGWPFAPDALIHVEGDLKRKDGVPLPVSITYAPVLTPDRQVVNILTTIRDMTRFRESEELKNTFMSVISHELKTPVALIKGYVSTLRRDDADWEKEIIQDSLEVIEEESDRLTEMIENLLDATRLQAGGLSLTMMDVDLRRLCERLVERFKTQTSIHSFVVDFDAFFPLILADEKRISQVISNLISNAIKYAKAGGVIRITGRTQMDQVIVCVQDEGPGIAPGDIPHIFNRFYRADQASKTTKGAGLGLFLSRAVIEAHDGRIWAESIAGSGARICFSLPRRED
jgi:PAS domain S-box-containing protein